MNGEVLPINQITPMSAFITGIIKRADTSEKELVLWILH